jgi:SAM-dependent methyltransferase
MARPRRRAGGRDIRALLDANTKALGTLRRIVAEQRSPTPQETEVLRGFAGWSGAPRDLFDERSTEWATKRAKLKELLGPRAYEAASATAASSRSTHPACVEQVWATLERLGFDGGRVLEPGVGSGAFIAGAPPSARITGVEIDPSVAALARTLHPEARIVTGSFAQHPFAEGEFDAVVGSVPSGRGGVDRISEGDRTITEALRLTRPGGHVAILTDHRTLDNPRSAARTEMALHADLVGAVRMPDGARGPATKGEGPTDLLVFRRREPDAKPADLGWIESQKRNVGDNAVAVSNYFAANPGHVLGKVTTVTEPGRRPRFHVEADLRKATLPEQLRAALEQIVPAREQALEAAAEQAAAVQPTLDDAVREVAQEAAAQAAAAQAAAAPAAAQEPTAAEAAPEVVAPSEPARSHPDLSDPVTRQLWDGRITAHPDGTFTRLTDGVDVPLRVPKTQQAELGELLELRDAATELVAAEAAGSPDARSLRRGLKDRHTQYVDRHGPIDRVEMKRTGHRDRETGEDRLAPVRPPVMGILTTDPDAALVGALDSGTGRTGKTKRNPLLTRPVIQPTREDPLEPHRDVLGPARSRWLEHRAGVAAVENARRDTAWWEAERDRTAPVLAEHVLDRGDARETLCIEHAEEVLRKHPDKASVTADDIAAAKRELSDAGRSLGDWTKRHGEDAAKWLAAKRRLAAGREAAMPGPGEQVETAVTTPAVEAAGAAQAIDASGGLDLGP